MVGGKRGDRRDDDAVARATNKQRPIAVPHVGVDLAPGLNICFDPSSKLWLLSPLLLPYCSVGPGISNGI